MEQGTALQEGEEEGFWQDLQLLVEDIIEEVEVEVFAVEVVELVSVEEEQNQVSSQEREENPEEEQYQGHPRPRSLSDWPSLSLFRHWRHWIS